MAKKQKYNIKMTDGTLNSVEGTVINKRWGIDKRIYGQKEVMRDGVLTLSHLTAYFLTHIPTGTLITNSTKQRTLIELANRPDMIEEDNLGKIAVAMMHFWDNRFWKD